MREVFLNFSKTVLNTASDFVVLSRNVENGLQPVSKYPKKVTFIKKKPGKARRKV